MKIQEETTSLFEQDKQYVLNYLKSRKVWNIELNKIIEVLPFGLLQNTSFYIYGEEYGISHFLGKSKIDGYDIQKVNTLLETYKTNIVVFAVVVGDDVLCYDTKSGAVLLWKVQTGNGEKFLIWDNLTEFLKTLK